MCIVNPVQTRLNDPSLTPVYNTGKMGLVSCAGSMCLGHESSGVIARLGSNLAALARKAEQAEKEQGSEKQAQAVVGQGVLKVGTRVTLEPGVTCRMCHDCRGGQYQVSRGFNSYLGVLLLPCSPSRTPG